MGPLHRPSGEGRVPLTLPPCQRHRLGRRQEAVEEEQQLRRTLRWDIWYREALSSPGAGWTGGRDEE